MDNENRPMTDTVSDLMNLLDYRPDTLYPMVHNINLPDFISLDGMDLRDLAFYQIQQLSYDEDYPHREAFENVLLSLDNPAFNFVYILEGDTCGIHLSIGIVKNEYENIDINSRNLQANDYGKIIEGAFVGNFGGSKIRKLVGEKLKSRILNTEDYESGGAIVGIPTENESRDTKKGFQGIDRLINSMLGLKWRMIVVAEPVQKKDLVAWQQNAYRIYDKLAPFSRNSIQQSINSGSSHSENTSDQSSQTKGTNSSKSFGTSSTHGSESNHTGENKQESKGISDSVSTSHTKGSTKSWNSGRSQSMTAEIINKSAQELMKYIDEDLLERIKCGFGRGIFKTSVYYMADNPSNANRLKVGILSLFQGKSSSYSPLAAYPLDMKRLGVQQLLKSFQNVDIDSQMISADQAALISRPWQSDQLGLNTWLTTNEVSLLAGLPQKEIPGISVVEDVDFGLNVSSEGDITLGRLIQKGRILHDMPFAIKRSALNKHTFVAGITGSGKTTTCHTLLEKAEMPFLVIEPAKTEYRALMNTKKFRDVLIFTVGNEMAAPLRFNPFELIEGENLSSHIDMLKATFTSAFPMEGSMPQLLEEAMYKCYEDKGWDVNTSQHKNAYRQKSSRMGSGLLTSDESYPILSDFLAALTSVVTEKKFSQRLQDDYIGSLVSRFSNLTKGAKGRMLNTSQSVNFDHLIHRNVIIELEDLKSSEDKSLLMGLILSRMAAVIKNAHMKDTTFRHLTLIEEAHRLLSRVEYGDSGAKKSAVETFTDLLAEVRKYGEGMIIVDQIPNKLAPEVIKNTSTKIIHKLLARDDKDTVGDAMLMDDKQKIYLSALETGQVVVFSENMKKPVHVAVDRVTDTSGAMISDQQIVEHFSEYAEIYCEVGIINRFYEEYDTSLTAYKNNHKGGLKQLAYHINAYLKEHDLAVDVQQALGFLVREKVKALGLEATYEKRLADFTNGVIFTNDCDGGLDKCSLRVLFLRIIKE